MKADIVIIDSGVAQHHMDDSFIIGGVCFTMNEKETCVDVSDDYFDRYGHGTATYNILINHCKTASYYIIRIFNETQETNQEVLLHALSYVYNNVDCDVVLISAGSVLFNELGRLEEITKKLHNEKGCLLVSAFNNEGAMSYPAACECVIGVDVSNSLSQNDSYLIIKGSCVNVLTFQKLYRLNWLDGKSVLQRGTSFAAAEFAARLFNELDGSKNRDIDSLLENIGSISRCLTLTIPDLSNTLNPKFLHKSKKMRAIAFPLSKELNVLATHEDMLLVDIVRYYDVPKSGKLGLTISDILGYGNNNKIVANIHMLEQDDDYELILCGHLGLLNKISKVDWSSYIYSIASKNSKYLYMLDPAPFQNDCRQYAPSLITHYEGYTFGKLWQIHSPVLGVFGTNSAQAKFSLQIKLRRALLSDGYSIGQISTEPTGALFGMDFTCPIGYNGSIRLPQRSAVKFYNELVHLCDIKNPDIILVAGQSGVLNSGIFNERFLGLSQYEFMVGTNPDAVILMINSYDEIKYVLRTISFIESALDSTVLACMLSPVKQKNAPIINTDSFVNEIMLKSGKPVYIYDNFQDLYDLIISFFGETA